MFYTRRPSASPRLWPRAIRSLSFALLVVLVTYCARAADPPAADPVDDFRAVFRKDYESVILRRTQDLPELRDKYAKLDKDPTKKNAVETTKAKDTLDKAEAELKTALDDRNAAVQKRIKDDLAKADGVEKVALVNLIGDEAQRLRYPDKKVIPDYVTKLHPEAPFLIELTEANPANSLNLRMAATLALGKSNGDPNIVVPALAKLLRDPKNPTALRLAAADALGRPVRRRLETTPVVIQDASGKTRPDTTVSDELHSVLIDSGHLSWPVFLDGLKDLAGEVRLACLSGVKDLSGVFRDNSQIAFPKEFFAEYAELIKVVRDTMPNLLPALEDADAAIQELALGILNDLATARLDLANKLPPPRVAGGADETRRPVNLPEAFLVSRSDDPPKAAGDDWLPAALKTALPALVKALQSKRVETRRGAARVLELLGDDAAAVIPEMSRGLRDADLFVRWTLLRALGRLAPREAKLVVPAVVPLVRDPDADVRMAALHTLEPFGKEAGSAAPALVDLLPRSEPTLQLAALKSLQTLNTWDGAQLGVVADLLQSPNADVRVSAAETLGRAGKAAAGTRPQLEKAMNDEDEKVRSAASEALLRLKN